MRRRVAWLVAATTSAVVLAFVIPLCLLVRTMAEVWRAPYGAADKTVDVHLSWLRRKLGESAAEPRYLHTVRGVGVRLVDPGEASGA